MTKLENATEIIRLLEVFYVAKPSELPQKVMDCIEYLTKGQGYARRNMPNSYENEFSESIKVLKKLHECFTECQKEPERGMLLTDKREGFSVNIKPILEFLQFMKQNGTACRNFDMVESLMVIYLYEDNIQEFKKVSSFIRNVETALYEYE